MTANSVCRRRLAGILVVAKVATCGVCYAVIRDAPKVSPFTDVRFMGDEVFVTYEGDDYQWLAPESCLNGTRGGRFSKEAWCPCAETGELS